MFCSVLFPRQERISHKGQSAEPAYFKDLNLDQILRPILAGYKEYGLDELFFTPLTDSDEIRYRQDILRDLENDELRSLFSNFSKTIFGLNTFLNHVQEFLASQDPYQNNYLLKGRIFDSADKYCSAIADLTDRLAGQTIRSEGLRGIVNYLREYQETEGYVELKTRVKLLREELSSVRYCMLIRNGTIRVRRYEEQSDLSVEIGRLFARFRQGNVQDYRHRLTEEPRAEHVEAAVLKLVAAWYPDVFSDLSGFCSAHSHFMDPTLARFAREIQFYISWLEDIGPLKQRGLPFCYPRFASDGDRLYDLDFFDLALAASLGSGQRPVTNDFTLNEPERILVVTGPNQGGKTTFARAFGQVHYLASLGLCVPGRDASLALFDQIYTHFEREEDIAALNGKLQDDLERLHQILCHATSKSIIVINEIFSSTTLSDALLLGGFMMDAIVKIGCPAVCVTFIDELAAHGRETVSMMSTVEEEDPTVRTFKVVRKPPDGLAYALHIVSKYNLTYRQLCARLKSRE